MRIEPVEDHRTWRGVEKWRNNTVIHYINGQRQKSGWISLSLSLFVSVSFCLSVCFCPSASAPASACSPSPSPSPFPSLSPLPLSVCLYICMVVSFCVLSLLFTHIFLTLSVCLYVCHPFVSLPVSTVCLVCFANATQCRFGFCTLCIHIRPHPSRFHTNSVSGVEEYILRVWSLGF